MAFSTRVLCSSTLSPPLTTGMSVITCWTGVAITSERRSPPPPPPPLPLVVALAVAVRRAGDGVSGGVTAGLFEVRPLMCTCWRRTPATVV